MGHRYFLSQCASAIQILRPLASIAETQTQLQPRFLRLSAMISQFFIRFRAIALMIMPVGLNCEFEFEKGWQLLICFHNKASSVAALCGHNQNWSAFAVRRRHTAAIPSSVAEIFDDYLPTLHGCFSSQSFWKAGSPRKGSQNGSSLRSGGVIGASRKK